MCNTVAAARRWRSATDLGRFQQSVLRWHAHRTDRDPAGQHKTQLSIVRDELVHAAERIENEVSAPMTSKLEAYEHCARCDRALSWLWRVFAFFRDKFDQRDDDALAPALLAADEVVWSCFRPFASIAAPKDPSPLPYLEAQYSPAGIRRNASLDEVIERGSGFEFLRDYFHTLPIAVLRLPLSAANAPWMLVLIGHETGHFVQPLIGATYTEEFADLIGSAARNAGRPGDDDVWRECGGEIFADWYSIASMGEWALWAMAQFEFAELRRRRVTTAYPSAFVRLAMLRDLVDHLASPIASGSAMAASLGLLEEQPKNEQERRDLAIAAAIAHGLKTATAGRYGTPAAMLGFRAADYGEEGVVAGWASVLSGQSEAAPRRRLEEARQLAAASAAAWIGVESAMGAARDALAETVRERTFGKIRRSAVEGTRAFRDVVTDESAGAALAARLLSLDVPEESAQR